MYGVVWYGNALTILACSECKRLLYCIVFVIPQTQFSLELEMSFPHKNTLLVLETPNQSSNCITLLCDNLNLDVLCIYNTPTSMRRMISEHSVDVKSKMKLCDVDSYALRHRCTKLVLASKSPLGTFTLFVKNLIGDKFVCDFERIIN